MNTERQKFNFICIGSGPAGLAAAQYASRANIQTLLIDQSMPGGQVINISELENYPGVFPAVKGFSFIENMKQQALSFGATIIQAIVSSVDKKDGLFIVTTNTGVFEAETLLLATGAEHRKLGIPGETEFSGRGVSYCATCDGPFFKNKNIFVVGGGDSACDEATYLATLTDHVTLVHRKSQFRAQKAVADRVLSNPHITVLFNSTVEQIKGDAKVSSIVIKNVTDSSVQELPADAVFIFVGMIPRTELLTTIKVDAEGYIVTNENMETVVPGLYAAGDVRSKSFRQIVTACSDGAIAAHQAEKFIREKAGEVYR